MFVGQRVGGRLRFQREECLDVRWRDPDRIRPEDLAFGGDRKALRLWADIKNGKARPEKDYSSRGDSGRSTSSRKRQRATALVIRDGRYLLVRDKGHDKYSLPGGGMERGEAALTAACREVGEELGLKAYKAEWLVVPDEPRWLEKAYRLMTRSDPRQRLVSQLLHRMLLDPGRAIRVHGDPALWQPGNQHSQIPYEDVYLVVAYSTAGADLLVTTDEGLFVALADNEDVDCQMHGEFLSQYPRRG